jgi:adenine-specific DNA-methyltransferase
MKYKSKSHSAKYTDDFVFSQLIPYIGNKRKLLGLIKTAIESTGISPQQGTFLDGFAGSGVVSRYAKSLGFAVTSNDWEPYAETLARCFVSLNEAPTFFGKQSYESVIHALNDLPPVEGWITQHLCPTDDIEYDILRDRMFYMRKNGMRFDAVRQKIAEWESAGMIDLDQRAALLGPLLYLGCWLSNTSGVFKGFHNGWGGQTGTALYRIQADFKLDPAIFLSNDRQNYASRLDAAQLAKESITRNPFDIAYLDPPYNQHPYGANYHVLNTLTLWDSPELAPKITGHGDKSAIRLDWRTERRSAYNYRDRASREYGRLVNDLNARFICTSYSTDGFIPLRHMLEANLERGHMTAFLQGYKRYRVSSQRFSEKPMNIEFVLSTDTSRPATRSADSYVDEILSAEHAVIAAHAETVSSEDLQGVLF